HYGNNNGPFKYQVNAKAFVSDHGVAGPTYNPTPNARQRYEKASLDFKTEGLLPKGFTFGRLEENALDYDITAFLDIERLDDTANNGDTSKLDAKTTGIGSNLFYTDTGETNELRFGTLLKHSQVDHTLSGDHKRDLASLNGVYTARIAPLILTAGVRTDYTSDFYFSPGANGGLSYEINKTTLIKANAGYSENIPSFGQLYQPSHGSMDQVRGNPNLEKEKIVSVSLGMLHTFDNKTELDFSLFRTHTRELIKYQRGADLISRPENINLAYTQGLETSLKFFLTRTTDLDLNYTWQDTRNRDNGKKLSYAPEHSLKLTLKTKLKTDTRLELTARGYTEQYTDTANTEAETIKAYITADAKIIHPLVLMDKKTEIFVHLHNLLDTHYESHYGYPDDGFTVQAGMNINF
ncbi:MAG: TonB-dependent receptor, partial [Proteobacteria bacterium]|nr:TonB-dependent receptor [Pseudomonadota bacterium]